MKSLRMLILCISLVSNLNCSETEPIDLDELDVDRYVELLKVNKYDASELPIYTYKDIPALLNYRNETKKITGFPTNKISSLALPECTLGMYILWTIESIRAVAIESEYLIGRFPSQNPIVELSEAPFSLADSEDVQKIIAQAYVDWWEDNKHKAFNDFKAIDPLADTIYRWH
jgi:hypothetical protein